MKQLVQGRYNRATYWSCIALIAMMYAAIVIVLKWEVHVSEVVLVIVCIPILHDIGKSGWLVMWGIGLEIATLIVGIMYLSMDNFLIVIGISTFVIAGLLIWLGCIPGEKGANRFGEAPDPGIHWKLKPKT